MTTLARDEPIAPAVTAGALAQRVSAEERLAEVAPMVRRMCAARLGPWDGQDAAQEALLRVWQMQQRPAYVEAAEAAPVFGWAAANARFAVLSAYRSPAGRMVPAGDLGERHWVDPAAGPEEQAERRAEIREARDRLTELIPQLSLRERQVILASQFATRSNVETAARLGISREAAAVAKQNAIARMRELTGVVAPAARAEHRAARYRESAEGRAVAARRAEQQAALVASAEELPAAVTTGGPRTGREFGRAGWPEEVHRAGRSAVRDGWTRADLIREFGVGADAVRRWRRASTTRADNTSAAEVPTAELIARAHEAVAEAQQRRAEVEAHAAVFGAPRGKGRVPEIVEAKAREAARRGWTPAEMEQAFAVHRATAKRWIAQEAESPAAFGEERDLRAPVRTEDLHAGHAVGYRRDQDPMSVARRAVAELPSPQQVRDVAEGRAEVEQTEHARRGDVVEHGADDVEMHADAYGEERDGSDVDTWSAA